MGWVCAWRHFLAFEKENIQRIHSASFSLYGHLRNPPTRCGVLYLVPYKTGSPKYGINMPQKLFYPNRSELVLYFKHCWSEISKKGGIFIADIYGGTSLEFVNILSRWGLVHFIDYSVNESIYVMHRCREIPCNQWKMIDINPKAIWLVLKFMQINGKIDGTGKDQTQLHTTTKIKYA